MLYMYTCFFFFFFFKKKFVTTFLQENLLVNTLLTGSFTVLSKSLGFEMRKFHFLFSQTFVENSLESLREISRHLERYFAAFLGLQRNFAVISEISPASK